MDSATASKGTRVLAAAGVLIGGPVGLFLALRMVPSLDVRFMSPTFHIAAVGAIAACTVVVALLAALAAVWAREASLVFLAIGCLGVGLGLLGHGLTTPGIGAMPENVWVGRLPSIAIAVFAFGLVAALVRPSWLAPAWVERHPVICIAVPTALASAAVAVIVLEPEVGHGLAPLPGEQLLRDLVSIASGGALLAAGGAHAKRWGLGGDQVQLSLTIAAWMGAQALLSLRFGRFWQLSWWDYHALLLIGFGAAVYAILAEYVRGREGPLSMRSIFRKEALAHIERGYPEALTALVAATEARDPYTRGHSRRVTQLSVLLGERMGLGPDDLRKLAWGAELHDIGKIGVPDYVLSKTGALSPDERALIEQHTVIGWEIARQSRSLKKVLDVIRSHHERVDGRGYPDGLSGRAIPWAARMVAVTDVWDALTSDRSYRPAWSRSDARTILEEGRGTQFDEECLDAFLSLLDEGVESSSRRVDPNDGNGTRSVAGRGFEPL